jgi:hypothetical protein
MGLNYCLEIVLSDADWPSGQRWKDFERMCIVAITGADLRRDRGTPRDSQCPDVFLPTAFLRQRRCYAPRPTRPFSARSSLGGRRGDDAGTGCGICAGNIAVTRVVLAPQVIRGSFRQRDGNHDASQQTPIPMRSIANQGAVRSRPILDGIIHDHYRAA